MMGSWSSGCYIQSFLEIIPLVQGEEDFFLVFLPYVTIITLINFHFHVSTNLVKNLVKNGHVVSEKSKF